ncbi:MAG: NUDIX hydrolase [Chloroflexi bacterium]|nr:NUDIX hydrolase [Chloroflexota bacterium]
MREDVGHTIRPERMVESSSKFAGKLVQVHVDTVELPGGRRATREVVEHKPAVVMIPFDDDGNIILVRQYRHAVKRALLEAPAGGIEPDEDPDEGAQRELQEEIGFYAEDLRRLGAFWTAPGVFTEYMYAYAARKLRPSELPSDPDEDIVTERVSVAKLERLIRVGEIQDGKTIAAAYMALLLAR